MPRPRRVNGTRSLAHFAPRIEEVRMPKALSPIERRIYNYLVDYLKRETYQPSIREIGSRFGIRSTKTVTEYLQSLQRKGYLDRTPSRSRALKILGLDLSPQTYTIPLYDEPVPEGWADAETQLELDRGIASSADCFFVRVQGDHLEPLGILEGDLLLIEPSSDPAPGDMRVLCWGGRVHLQSTDVETSVNGTGDNAAGGNGSTGARMLGVARGVVRTIGDIH